MIKMSFRSICILWLFILFSSVLEARVLSVSAQNFEESLNQAIDEAQSGDTIQMPAGRFEMSNELLVDKPGLRLQGLGPNKTVLNFKNQKAGPQGILGTKDQLHFSDFAVEDTAGNGIKVIGSKGVVFDRIRVTWTNGPQEKNGSYGIYPVLTKNVLIQDCDVSGASDAGLYVGQSKNIIVRRNHVHGNVAGLEIENSSDADVYENLAEENTVGLLVFNLPDLLVKEGRRIRMFHNQSKNNNLKNFSTKGSIINLMPAGIGMFVLAAKDVEIFQNQFLGNKLSGVGISNYYISGRKINDPTYDPMPQGISVFQNTISKSSMRILDFNQTTLIIKLIFGLRSPSILYDGIDDGTYNGKPPSEENKICITSNVRESGEAVDFGNLHLDHQRKNFPFPGGPGTTDLSPHFCQHARLPEVFVEALNPEPGHEQQPSQAEVLEACKSQSIQIDKINRRAVNYNCPSLSDYRLFKNPSDSTKNPNENGFSYKLNNELFTDYAEKNRFVFLPENTVMTYKETGSYEFPVGTIITKTFSLSVLTANRKKLIPVETRMLIRRAKGWVPLNYIWEADGKTAHLKYGGQVLNLDISPYPNKNEKISLNYHIPNLRQCASCHHINNEILPVGLKSKFLNWNFPAQKNQLKILAEKNLLQGLPEDISKVQKIASWWDASEPSLEKRVQSYLDINCSHCHNPVGNARNTGLYLNSEVDPKSKQYGICKTPVAAGIGSGGHSFAIQPGSSKDSVLYYRINQSHLAVKMPQLGRSAVHKEAAELIQSWIDSMEKNSCKIN